MPTPLARANGELAGSTTRVQCPTIQCSWVRFTAPTSNVTNVCFGNAGVTLPAGTTTTTAGTEIAPGGDAGWRKCNNLNEFYYISVAATDDLLYETMP